MADLLPTARQLQTSGNPAAGPRYRGHGVWLRIAVVVGLAAIVTVLAVIGQSAGAAGGCGGG